jgi:transcriptional regulator with XRE-family HTH domain
MGLWSGKIPLKGLHISAGNAYSCGGYRQQLEVCKPERPRRKIGVAFQQVQKYERGINRVGASRLSRIAAVLGISIGELFESSEDKSAGSKSPFRLLAERDALRVLKAFSRTSDPRVRRAIAQLVESVADQHPPVKSSMARPAAAKRRERRPRTSGTQA